MAKLPSLTVRKVIRALKRAGFVEDRQRSPVHPGRSIKERLQLAIVWDAGLSRKFESVNGGEPGR